jgi:HK97 family phage portal protein
MSLLSSIKNRISGRKRHEPERDTQIYPRLMQVLGGQRIDKKYPVYKPTPWNLRAFARTPYARRAINAIKGPISRLAWEVVPKTGIDENSEIKRQCEIVTRCLLSPNHDDSWRSLAERVIEDILSGAGAIEIQLGGDKDRPLWLYPVDGLSIQLYPGWSGDPSEAKYNQIPGYGQAVGGNYGIDLRADELIYIAPNPSTSHPFGTGALEVAFTSISRMIGVSEYAANLASNARPNILLQVVGGDQTKLDALRAYWTNEVEGQGKTPLVGVAKDGEIKAVNLTAEGDKALYLAYQEALKTEIAISFDLSPMNLGVERDVNRNTAEVAEDRDWAQAILPHAGMLASHINRDAIEGKLGFSQIEFRFIGLDREDEKATADILTKYYDKNVYTANEIRDKLGDTPAENIWGDKTAADVAIAISAARGSAQVDDADLTGKSKPTSSKKGK